jgi:hypothetical protein
MKTIAMLDMDEFSALLLLDLARKERAAKIRVQGTPSPIVLERLKDRGYVAFIPLLEGSFVGQDIVTSTDRYGNRVIVEATSKARELFVRLGTTHSAGVS